MNKAYQSSQISHINLINLLYPASRGGNGELCVGVRRQAHRRHNIGSSPVSSQTVQGVLAVVSHAFATKRLFSVYYQPRYNIHVNLSNGDTLLLNACS